MNLIDKAIEQKMHVTQNQKLRNQTWQEFEKALCGKELWIFGAGKAAGRFWERYAGSFCPKGIVDNDKRKWGNALKDFVGITEGTLDGELRIEGPETLKIRTAREIIVLITSIRYYEDICGQLEQMGIEHLFALLVMEANESGREERAISEREGVSREELYAIKCLKYPVEYNKILIYTGNYGSHGKQISGKLAKLDAKLDIVWVIENPAEEKPQGIRTVLAGNWKEYIKELETAHIWIFGDMIPGFARKRAGQIYIQTKHWSSITLKKFYWDLENYLSIPTIREYYAHNNEAIDYIFVGSTFDENSCRSGFNFKGECVHVGSCRTDILFEPGKREKVCSFYRICTCKKIALYAPTFRAAGGEAVMGQMKHVDLDFIRLEKALRERFGGEWVILLRIHPYVAMESTKVRKPSFVTDASYYPESQELVAASDLMITDYSSLMFEPAFTGRPVFLYAPDKKEYVGKERELLLDYDSLPFPVSESNDELMETIVRFEPETYNRHVEDFLDFYGVHEDGHASERAAEFIYTRLLEKEQTK